MNLQEHVSNSIQGAWTEWADNHGRIPGSDQLADAAIAAMREALLSESVLRVAGEVLVNRWDDDSVANEWELAEVMVESMLHAIGATKKEI